MPDPIDLLVLCELNPDVIVRLGDCGDGNGPVRFGQVEQLVDAADLTLGSSGAITASAAAAQGVRAGVCGVVGADRSGAAVLEMLSRLGVDTASVRVAPELATGMTVVLARRDGDRAMFTFPGAMSALHAGAVPSDVIARARHIHVSSIHLQTGLVAGLGQLLAARASGSTSSLDPGWDPSEQWSTVLDLLPQLDFLLPNEAECLAIAAAAEARSGRVVAAPPADGDPDSAVEHAAAVLAGFGPTVVVKCGPRGAVSVSPGGSVVRVGTEAHRPLDTVPLDTVPLDTVPIDAVPLDAVPIDTVPIDAVPFDTVPLDTVPLDTTGAGDNFDAGYLAGVLDGAGPDAALARGVASGAISVRGIGGTAAMATAAEALALASRLLTGVSRSNRPFAQETA